LFCDLKVPLKLLGVLVPPLAALAFSSLSALKKTSSGEEVRGATFFNVATEAGCGQGDAGALSSELSSFVVLRSSRAERFGTDREKARGSGREEGAGEAWNVGPA
jgi:hypothetical protein